MNRRMVGTLVLALGFGWAAVAAAFDPPIPKVPGIPSGKDVPKVPDGAKDPKKLLEEKNEGLKKGDAAPGITVDEWIKGEAVTSFEKGKVYVVEFFALNNGPSLAAMPTLEAAAKKHKTVTIMSIASSDRMTKPELLKEWAKKNDKMISYRVGYDAKGTMRKDWMDAAKIDKLPGAFIVDRDGKIFWMGELKSDFEEHLSKAVKQGTTKK